MLGEDACEPGLVQLLPNQAGWGDDEAGAGPLNPHYNAARYAHLGDAARRNLGRVDENRIDYDLLEELMGHIDASYEEGAILVFLPGDGDWSCLRSQGCMRQPARRESTPLSSISPMHELSSGSHRTPSAAACRRCQHAPAL